MADLKILGGPERKKSKWPYIVIGAVVVASAVSGFLIFEHNKTTLSSQNAMNMYNKIGVEYKQGDYNKDKKAGPIVEIPSESKDEGKKEEKKQNENNASKSSSSSQSVQNTQKFVEKPKANKVDVSQLSTPTQKVFEKNQSVINHYADPDNSMDNKQSSDGYKPSVVDLTMSLIDQTRRMNDFVWNQYAGFPRGTGKYDDSYDAVRDYNTDLVKWYEGKLKADQLNSAYDAPLQDQMNAMKFSVFNNMQFQGPNDNDQYKNILDNYARQGFFYLNYIDHIVLTESNVKFDKNSGNEISSMIKANFTASNKTYVAYLSYESDGTSKQYKIIDIFQSDKNDKPLANVND